MPGGDLHWGILVMTALLGRTRAGQRTHLAPPALDLLSWLDHRDLGTRSWSPRVFLSGNGLPERGMLLSLEVLLLFNKALCGIVPSGAHSG